MHIRTSFAVLGIAALLAAAGAGRLFAHSRDRPSRPRPCPPAFPMTRADLWLSAHATAASRCCCSCHRNRYFRRQDTSDLRASFALRQARPRASSMSSTTLETAPSRGSWSPASRARRYASRKRSKRAEFSRVNRMNQKYRVCPLWSGASRSPSSAAAHAVADDTESLRESRFRRSAEYPAHPRHVGQHGFGRDHAGTL